MLTLLLTLALAGATVQERPSTAPRTPTQSLSPGSQSRAESLVQGIADRLWEAGDLYWHAGRHEDLIAVDYLVMELDPDFLDAYTACAFLINSAGRPAEAEALLRRAVGKFPRSWNAWSELGDHLLAQKRYPEAAASYETAAALPNCWTKIYRSLGHSYRLSGDLPKSLRAWERASQLEPDDAAVQNNLRRVRGLIEAGRNR